MRLCEKVIEAGDEAYPGGPEAAHESLRCCSVAANERKYSGE